MAHLQGKGSHLIEDHQFKMLALVCHVQELAHYTARLSTSINELQISNEYA